MSNEEEFTQEQGGAEEIETNPQDDTKGKIEDEGSDAGSEKIDGEIYGSPETFDYSEIKLPDGIELDKEMVGKFDGIAKELNLSNKSANKLMNLAVELTGKQTVKVTDLATELQKEEAKSYLQLLNTDKELNAYSKEEYDQYVSTADLGIKSFATEGLKKLIKDKGLTHHPELIKTFHKIGKLCKDDKIPGGNPPSTERPADILFGDKN